MNYPNFHKFKKSVRFNSARYEYGTKEESKQLLPLQKFFKDDTIKPLPEGSRFDFMGEGIYIELKTRTCKKEQYETTCISVGKVHYAKQHCHESIFYFVFNFTDGMAYWKYNPEQPLTYHNIFNIPHYFIPVSYLTSM